MRIAFAAVLAFAALWFVALRPKPVEDVAPAPAPAPAAKPKATKVTERPAQAAKAVGKANEATAGRQAAAQQPAQAQAAKPAVAKADPAPATAPKAQAPEPAAAAKPAQAKPAPARKLSGGDAVVADVKAGRTVVLLFWDGKATEDKAVRRAVARVDRRGGKVRVHVANLRNLSRYGAITRSVPVTDSPTVLVIGKGGKAEAIRGLTVTAEIDDAVAGVLRAGA